MKKYRVTLTDDGQARLCALERSLRAAEERRTVGRCGSPCSCCASRSPLATTVR